MFNFLKEKLKQGIKNISSRIKEGGESGEGAIEEPISPAAESRIKGKTGVDEEKEDGKKTKTEEKAEERKEREERKEKENGKKIGVEKETGEEEETEKEEQEAERKEKEAERKEKEAERKEKEAEKKSGLLRAIKEKITTKRISREQFEKLFMELEIGLLESSVAVEVIEKLREDLAKELTEKPLPRIGIEGKITKSLAGSIEQLLKADSFNLVDKVKEKTRVYVKGERGEKAEKEPYVICFIGVNGSGKTTTIAKIARMLLDNSLSVVLAASDTFRAASIEQLQLHADRLGIRMIKHNYGSDPAAVAFDAVKYAKAKSIDAVLIDTAGRIHSNINLIDEMKKIIRVAKPDLKIFVGESITGNDCVEQSKRFDDAIGIDCIILAKADVDEKGGAAISVSYVTKKPIIYIGTGQGYDDLEVFDASAVMKSLGIY